MVQQLRLDDPPRVLAIEPDRAYLAVIARRLGELGIRVAAARNAQDGFAELHRSPVELVMSEMRLPGTGGIELVRMIRDDPANRHLPILLIAGRSERRAFVDAFAAGVDGVVRKPFTFEFLAARIGREIERARAFDQLRDDNAALDARVVSRAIELGEMRALWERSEAERRRLELEVRAAA